MTPGEHVAQAEQGLEESYDLSNEWTPDERVTVALNAIGHALVAIAVELGAPHAAAPAGSGDNGA